MHNVGKLSPYILSMWRIWEPAAIWLDKYVLMTIRFAKELLRDAYVCMSPCVSVCISRAHHAPVDGAMLVPCVRYVFIRNSIKGVSSCINSFSCKSFNCGECRRAFSEIFNSAIAMVAHWYWLAFSPATFSLDQGKGFCIKFGINH